MKALVLAAGLGTRLRPFTLRHPKALVEVGGTPMLARVLRRLELEGYDDIVVNIHHFGNQIVDWLAAHKNKLQRVVISDETDALLDTGGAILHARSLLGADGRPFLVHNVDILSDASLRDLMRNHEESGRDVTLLVSDRESSRKLVFDKAGRLVGWHNVNADEYKPVGFAPSESDCEYAFSGIQVVSPRIFEVMEDMGCEGRFSIIDFLLASRQMLDIGMAMQPGLHLMDIGKPATLSQANKLFI